MEEHLAADYSGSRLNEDNDDVVTASAVAALVSGEHLAPETRNRIVLLATTNCRPHKSARQDHRPVHGPTAKRWYCDGLTHIAEVAQ